MQLIYDLMQKNKETIAQLKRKLKKSDARLIELEKMINTLQKQMEEKELEITDLKSKLEQMNIKVTILTTSVDSLKTENANTENVIANKTEELNTAWYVYGTRKELEEHQVITKEGGFIGIGRIEKLKDSFNKDYFTKVDITKLTSIPLNVKKAHLVTRHPSSSYKFEGSEKKVDKLNITNPTDFWSTSKYLVIVVE
jgi:seryl-tRNA synthetase